MALVTLRDPQAWIAPGCRLRPGVIMAGLAARAGGPGRAQVRAEEREDTAAGTQADIDAFYLSHRIYQRQAIRAFLEPVRHSPPADPG